jgi:hypothetical protein
LYISIHIDELGYDLFNLYDAGNFHQFLFDSLHFIDLWNNHWFFNYFLYNLLGSNNLLNSVLDWNYLFNDDLNFFDLISNIGNLLNDFPHLSINNNSLLHF